MQIGEKIVIDRNRREMQYALASIDEAHLQIAFRLGHLMIGDIMQQMLRRRQQLTKSIFPLARRQLAENIDVCWYQCLDNVDKRLAERRTEPQLVRRCAVTSGSIRRQGLCVYGEAEYTTAFQTYYTSVKYGYDLI